MIKPKISLTHLINDLMKQAEAQSTLADCYTGPYEAQAPNTTQRN